MGDRALVIFTNKRGSRVSPTVYLHWGGHKVPELLKTLEEFMIRRYNDVSYGCARFIGHAHAMMPDTNLSLGVWNTDQILQKAIKDFMIATNTPDQFGKYSDSVLTEAIKVIANDSHGDAGTVIVDTSDYTWHAFGGYLINESREVTT